LIHWLQREPNWLKRPWNNFVEHFCELFLYKIIT
jgi:hypothetical protein